MSASCARWWSGPAIALCLAAAACGDDAASMTDATVAYTPAAAIASMEEPDGDDLIFHTQPTLPEEGPGVCHATIDPIVIVGAEDIHVDLRLITAARPPFDGCALAARTVRVTLQAMPAEVRVRDTFGGWFAYVDGKVTNCPYGQVCDDEPASCDNATLRDAIASADVPRRFHMEERCEAPFAVVDVDYGAGACSADDSAPNRCAGLRVHRHYWRITDDRWTQIGLDDGAGCGDIHALAPDFPSELCADLPALG